MLTHVAVLRVVFLCGSAYTCCYNTSFISIWQCLHMLLYKSCLSQWQCLHMLLLYEFSFSVAVLTHVVIIQDLFPYDSAYTCCYITSCLSLWQCLHLLLLYEFSFHMAVLTHVALIREFFLCGSADTCCFNSSFLSL